MYSEFPYAFIIQGKGMLRRKEKALFMAVVLFVSIITGSYIFAKDVQAVHLQPVESEEESPSNQVIESEEESPYNQEFETTEQEFDMEWTVTDGTNVEETDTEQSSTGATTSTVKRGLVAHWTFDGNYNETESGLTTNLGAKAITYTEGIHGKAAVFNGKDNYLYVDADPILNLGNSIDQNNDNFSISAWVNLGDSKYGTKYLLDKGKDIGWEKNDDCFWSNPYRIKFETCEPIADFSNYFERMDPDFITEGGYATGGKHVEGEEWFLLTITYEGKRVKIYRDNELLTQSNYTDGITFNNDELYIGVDGKLQSYFKGAVDDLRIYTTTLSYDDVNDLYEKGLKANKELVEPTKKLVAYYNFDGNLKDSSSYKNNAEKVAIGGTTKYVIGKNGKAITMSKGNYILVPAADQLNLETEFTVSFWIKVNAEGEFPILYRQNPSYSDQDGDNDWTYKLTTETWGSFETTRLITNTAVYNPDEWVPEQGQNLSMEFNYEDEKIKGSDWLHYTSTYKDGQMKSYLNGKLINKSEKSDLVNISNASGDLLIGYDGDTFINGSIDELKIYSKCLSATDVAKEAKRIDTISLSSDKVKTISSIGKGKTITLTEIQLKDGDKGKTSKVKAADQNVTWKTSNNKVFTVAKGKITGVKAGKAKLIIIYGGNSVTYNVVVK